MSSRSRPSSNASAGEPIGGGDDAHVDRQIRGAADAIQSLGFEHAQQARLQIERHFRDLVEQQRAAVRALEDSFTRTQRAREAAALMAEQFGLDECRGNRGAIERDERLAGARTHGMHRFGDEFLAAAALAADQHRRIGRRDARDELAHLLHPRRIADESQRAILHSFRRQRVPVAQVLRRDLPAGTRPSRGSGRAAWNRGVAVGDDDLDATVQLAAAALALLATGNPSP